MRSAPFLVGTAFVAASALIVAAPASAATSLVEITESVVVHTTDANFEYGVYTPWAPEGPATFPSIVPGGTSYVLQGYQPVLPTELADCTVDIVSFSVSLELLQAYGFGTQTGVYVGVPADGVDGTTAEFDGTGSETPSTDETWWEVAPVNGVLDGVLTITLPEPTPIAETFPFVGLYTTGSDPAPLWSVNGVTFVASATCPDPAPAPVAVLPATGQELPALALFGGLALLAVGGALTIARLRAAR